jgi:hypothetical protein
LTAPARRFLNDHFESVKEEVRVQTGRSHAEVVTTLAQVDAHEAERIGDLDRRIDELGRRIDGLATTVEDLRLVTARLAEIVAPMFERGDGPTHDADGH